MPLHVSSICAHHQEVKIALHNLWYHHTYKWPSGAQVERERYQSFFLFPTDAQENCLQMRIRIYIKIKLAPTYSGV